MCFSIRTAINKLKRYTTHYIYATLYYRSLDFCLDFFTNIILTHMMCTHNYDVTDKIVSCCVRQINVVSIYL